MLYQIHLQAAKLISLNQKDSDQYKMLKIMEQVQAKNTIIKYKRDVICY
jgi:hypothetical protein